MKQLALIEQPRWKVYLGKCLCYPCWCARCTSCGEPLTKHAFTEQDAEAEAFHALTRTDRWRHDCPAERVAA